MCSEQIFCASSIGSRKNSNVRMSRGRGPELFEGELEQCSRKLYLKILIR